MRPDVFSYLDWTSFYDVSPMRETLAEVCDFNQLNDPTHMRVAVTATNVQTGDQVCFANYAGNPDSVYYVTSHQSRPVAPVR
jgi:NTE family protein